MFAAIRSKLNDREPKVRFVAQQIVSEHLSQHESNLQTNDAVWELSNGINSIYEHAFPVVATAYFDDARHEKVSELIALKLDDKNWLIGEEALKIISTCIPYLDNACCDVVIRALFVKLSIEGGSKALLF